MKTKWEFYFYLCIVIALTQILSTDANTEELQKISTSLRQHLNDAFSENRHSENESNKVKVRKYITEALRNYKLEVKIDYFSGYPGTDYTGENIVGILAGERKGTVNDKVVLMGAHYDTTSDTPGVDDNGSGVSALLEAARMVTSGACKPKNTILFVAFDLEELQDESDFDSGFLGSKHFVDVWLQDFLNGDSNARSQFQGALIMDTIMNYNKVINTQKYPDELLTYFPEVKGHLINRDYRGDFITVIGRRTDAELSAKFTSHLSGVKVADTYTEIFELPVDGVPTEQQMSEYYYFAASAHIRFWQKESPYLKALFITDTANFRIPMVNCFHKQCDDKSRITDENLMFLARTTKAAANMLIELGDNSATDCPVDVAATIQPYCGLPYLVMVAIIYLIIDRISH